MQSVLVVMCLCLLSPQLALLVVRELISGRVPIWLSLTEHLLSFVFQFDFFFRNVELPEQAISSRKNLRVHVGGLQLDEWN